MDIIDVILNVFVLGLVILMVVTTINTKKRVKMFGEIKYKGFILSGFSKFCLVSFLVNSSFVLSQLGIKGLITDATMSWFFLLYTWMFSTQYTITTEGIMSRYANQGAVFYIWEDIMVFKFVGNRKGKYTVIDEKGNMKDYTVTFKKKDYDHIKGFINGHV